MISVSDFDMGLSVGSGQPLTFHGNYERIGNKELLSYATTKGMVSVKSVMKNGEQLIRCRYSGCSSSEARNEVERRLGIDDDMKEVYSRINTDAFMARSIREFKGMRITQNDPWETTLCFVISQFNNIKRIRGIVRRLMERYGEEYENDGSKARLFPTPEALARADTASIKGCGAGFRARYIRGVAEACSHSIDLDSLYGMNYDDAKAALLELDGIGDKVADCILLYGYKKLDAFPIDTWIKRVMERVYFKGRKQSVGRLHEFADTRWQGYQGYAQQYLFHAGRMGMVVQ